MAAVICDVVVAMGIPVLKMKRVLPILVLVGVFVAIRLFNVNIILVILFCGALGAWDTARQARKKKEQN